ncbi:hypothetical protein B0A55_11818 [Friedmanniomyces simplex]|uniref:Nitrogen permease regulator 2 n=1 Tax=Friedmanniomyces simplex TaxID=329884 RepID=A0A4U0WXN6_9PEZI|nr:hypothetical protein B0A55_11818 [Friedmanniomyces simplex]
MLKAVFYARFHPERGPSVVHQYPNGSIVPTPADRDQSLQALVSFSDISAYIIPPYELCNRPFSICSGGHRVLGFPVSLEDAKYERNRFTFNVCFVLDEKVDARPWLRVVSKAAAFFRAMEEEDGLLQAEERLPGLKWAGEEGYPADGTGIVHTLLKAIVQDLNAYEETCVRLDDLHVLNLQLLHPRPPPTKVQPWDVPLLIRDLPSPEQWTWDLTLQRIYPHLDGVKHIQRICDHADVELKLVRRAVRELIYHQRAILLDLFHFQAIYTPTADLPFFVNDAAMLEECARYVATRQGPERSTPPQIPTPATLIALYTSLALHLPLHSFVSTTPTLLSTPDIDLHRLITFGTTKAFLRRVHKYALALAMDAPNSKPLSSTQGSDSSPAKSKPKSSDEAVREFDRAWKRAALSSGWATPPSELAAAMPVVAAAGGGMNGVRTAAAAEDGGDDEVDEKLRGFLDGTHCFDEICVALRMTEKGVLERLGSGRFGEVLVFTK